MASLRERHGAGAQAGTAPARTRMADRMGEGASFDEGLFERLVDRQREHLFGGETPEGELSQRTQAALADTSGQAGPPGRAVETAVEACVAVMQEAERGGVEIPPIEGIAASIVAVNDVAEAMKSLGEPLSPEQGVQAMYATVENVALRGQQAGVWTEEEATEITDSILEDPERLQEQIRALDPEGAAVLEREAVDAAPDLGAGPAPPAQGPSLASVAGPGGVA